MPKIGVAAIEDDVDIRESERELLLDAGYDVLEADSGLEGKRLIASSRERLIVLLDHLTPVLDGCKLLELVAQGAVLRARHTFVVLSASPALVRKQCAAILDKMRIPILPKPFTMEALLRAVQDAEQRLRSAV
jgi:CheY-like chemotaxis protein